MNASEPLNDVSTSQMVDLFFEDLTPINYLFYHKLHCVPSRYKMMSVNFRARHSGVTPMGSGWANPRAPGLRGHPQGAPSLKRSS